MNSKQEARMYPYTDKYGKTKQMKVTYTLYFDESNMLVDVRNQHGHSVERKSDVWEYFDNKYNML